jgi:hypothetical protein
MQFVFPSSPPPVAIGQSSGKFQINMTGIFLIRFGYTTVGIWYTTAAFVAITQHMIKLYKMIMDYGLI